MLSAYFDEKSDENLSDIFSTILQKYLIFIL